MKTKKGFTLAELLVVVAIIGVLVAIAIPVFTSSLDKSRDTVCAANLTASQHVVSAAWLLDNNLDTTGAEAVIKNSVGAPDGLCPKGGKYSVKTDTDGHLVVSCSIHGKTAVQSVVDYLAEEDTTNFFDKEITVIVNGKTETTTIKEYFSSRGEKSSLDSTGTNYGTYFKDAIAQSLNITTDFDFRIWKGMEDGKWVHKVYIFEPITLEDNGNTITAIRYTYNEKWEKTGEAETGTASVTTATMNNAYKTPYAVLNAASFQSN